MVSRRQSGVIATRIAVLVGAVASVLVGVVPATAAAEPDAGSVRRGPLTLTMPAVDLGRLELGSSRVTHVPLVNTSGASVKVGAFSFFVRGSWLRMTSDCAGRWLAPGAACDLAVTATAQALGAVTSSAASVTLGTQRLRPRFTLLGYSTLQLTPRQLTPAQTFVGDAPRTQWVTLMNLGTRPRTITAQQPPRGPFTTTGSCVGTLGPGASCRVGIAYAPRVRGSFDATALTFAADGGESLSTAVDETQFNLESTALDPFLVSATALDFGQVAVGTRSAPQSVTVTNVSNTDRQPTGTFTPDAHFGGVEGCTGRVLAPGGSCRMTFAFTPGAAGPTSAVVSGTWGPTPWSVTLRGEGVTGSPTTALLVSPTVLDLGDVRADETRSREVTVRNQTTAPVTLHGAVDPHPIFVRTGTCRDGVVLAAGGTCSMVFSVTPTNRGNLFVDLQPITGAWGGQRWSIGIVAGQSLRLLRWDSSRLDFGVGDGTIVRPPQIVTVTNDGAGPTTVASTPFTAGDGVGVTDTCRGATLAPAATCTVTATWSSRPDPTRTGPVDRTSAGVTWNGSVISFYAYRTTVLPTRTVALTADFGPVTLGASRTITLPVVNDDDAAHAMTATVTSSNPDVVATTTCDGSVRPAGGGCAIVATWTPTTPGTVRTIGALTGAVGRYALSVPLSGTLASG